MSKEAYTRSVRLIYGLYKNNIDFTVRDKYTGTKYRIKEKCPRTLRTPLH